MSYNEGWVVFYRRLIDWEWFRDSKTLQLFVYCIFRANITPGSWRGIDYQRGEFITTLANLSAATGQTTQEIRTRLLRLKSTGEISIKTTNKYTIIIICKYDIYQPSITAMQQRKNKDGQQTTNKQQTNKQHKYKNIRNNHTHVDTERKGVVGEKQKIEEAPKQVEARELIEWIANNVPTVAGMAEPLTEQNAIWILRKYSIETARRIIQDMHNKRAFSNMNAYTTFTNFARYDKILSDSEIDDHGPAKRYTWDEVLTYVDKHSGTATTSDFTRQVIDGVPVWFKKSNI